MPNPTTATPPRRLIASSKVSGTGVFNVKGERLGHVDELMIDKASGRVAYAVLAFGGFLGFNDKHFPLPWNELHYDLAVDGYVVDMDRETLKHAPAYDAGSHPGPALTEADSFYAGRGQG